MSEPTQARRQTTDANDQASAKARRVARKPAVARPAYVQAKMAVSHPSDPSEAEADQVADEISRMPRGVSRQADEQVQKASVDPGRGITDPDQELTPKLSRTIHRSEIPAEEQSLAPKLQRQADDELATLRRSTDQPGELQRQADASEQADVQAMANEPQAAPLRREAGEETEQAKLQRSSDAAEDSVQPRLRRSTATDEAPAQAKLRRSADSGENNVQTRLHRDAVAADDTVQTALYREASEGDEAIQAQLLRAPEATPETVQARLNRTPEADDEIAAMDDGSAPETATDDGATTDTPSVDDQTEQQIDSLRGQGDPLPDAIQQEMSEKFGHDFSTVRVHTDDQAASLCARINARAFAVGDDLFFAPGEFAPDTEAGRKLLAHELTHVVQQLGGTRRMLARDEPPADPGAGSSTDEYTLSDGTEIKRRPAGSSSGERRIKLPTIDLPEFKDRNASVFPSVLGLRPTARGPTQQKAIWERTVASSATALLTTKLENARSTAGYLRDSQTYFFKATNNPDLAVFGTESQLREKAILPFWDENGQPHTYQIDHILEDQLVNPNDEQATRNTADFEGNFELLDATANGSSGSTIAAEVQRRTKAVLDLHRDERENSSDPDVQKRPLNRHAIRHYIINFKSHSFTAGVSGEPNNYWTADEIKDGDQLSMLEPMSESDMENLGREGEPLVFPSPQGGEARRINTANLPISSWLPRVTVKGMELEEDPSNAQTAGYLVVDAYKASEGATDQVNWSYQDMRWRLSPIAGIYGGAIDADYVKANYLGARSSLRLPGLSPIEIDTFSIGDAGIQAEGRVLPTVPLVSDADIRIRISGEGVELFKTFDMGEIAVPPPFAITDSSLTVFFSSGRGLGIEGEADFEISRIGNGHLGAAASTEGGFSLDGEFNFDSQLFDPARVTIGYREDHLSLGGEIAIPEGKITGIKNATINATYEEGAGFTATGEAELDIPGVESGTLTISQSEEQGFSIGGSFNLSPDVPGIRGGTISAELRERPDGEGYSISASGEAQPDIPGINSALRVSYEDGAITMEAEAQYQRGMLDGSINVGATNRTLDAEGNPTGEPGEDIVVYGGGSLTIQIAPWLQGTAGVQFAPDGEITVTGEIGLPDQLEIFPRAEIDKSIFSIAVQAPIVPGIVAEIGGGLGAVAGIGPGVIDELRLGIEYNPAHEENTHITGDAHLSVPADAGLRLSVRAGIGLGITGASATGGLEIGGTLGIAGAAEAGVHIDWMPSTGLEINADVSVHAQPSFTFDISGYVSVRALGFSVYDQTWELASFSFGSDYTFGISLPVHYREGEPFDVSVDDVEFQVPDIDTDQLMQGLIDRVT